MCRIHSENIFTARELRDYRGSGFLSTHVEPCRGSVRFIYPHTRVRMSISYGFFQYNFFLLTHSHSLSCHPVINNATLPDYKQ